MRANIEFRPVQANDLPQLRQWITQPHWQEWWGVPDQEIGYIENMLSGEDSTEPYIAQIEGQDMAYIQCWFPQDHLVEPWLSQAPWMMHLPHDAVGVDLSIGEVGQLGRGFGTAIIRQFVKKLCQRGYKTILIDPEITNKRAISAYKKAGFRAIPAFLGKTGDVFLMQYAETPLETKAQ